MLRRLDVVRRYEFKDVDQGKLVCRSREWVATERRSRIAYESKRGLN